ncbi:MAG: tetratricopeptide repeat protein, partial [Pirellulaceae bacterium]|nr:tetratricopeptide repeat protein [Pirellulaceae bacterium]
YSLGVLLYELLTGTTPFDQTRLQAAAFDEVRRIICEEEPQKPSTRVSSLGATLPSVCAVRSSEPRRLSQLLRGDLDWIVMRALEKDRTRRYPTANGFAADVLRYLADEPVTACPPSAGYRFRKFTRRNRAALTAAGFVAVTLVAGIIGTTSQAIRATRAAGRAGQEAERARTARAAESAQRLIAVQEKQAAVTARNLAHQKEREALEALEDAKTQRAEAEANFAQARAAVDQYLSQVTESELLAVPGLQPLREDLLKAALHFYSEFTSKRTDDPTLQRELASARYRLGRIHAELGNAEAARADNAEAIRLYERLRDANHFPRDTQVALAWAYFFAARYDDTTELCQDVLQTEPGHAEARSLLADTWNVLAVTAKDKQDVEAACTYHRQAFELRESLVRDEPDNPRFLAQLGGSLNNLGTLLSSQGKREEALAMYQRAVQYMQQAYDRAPHSLLWGRWLYINLRNVAAVQAELGQQQEALTSYQRYVAVTRKRVFENPAITSLRGELCQAHLRLARYQRQLGNASEANRSFREARELLENIPRETSGQLYELATVYAALAQPPEGEIRPDPEEAVDREHHVGLTLDTLRKAIDAGFHDAKAIQAEGLFDPLRDRADFQQVVTTLERAAQAQQLVAGNAGSVEQTLANRLQAAELLKSLDADQPGNLRHRSTLAATLHSIGVIQTGLKQFDEAEQALVQALELRDTLRHEQPGKPDPEVDWLSTRIALGNVCWSSARFAEGHRIWQQCTDDLRRIAESQRDNAALQDRIAIEERFLCGSYGRYGLWPLAGEYVRRSAEFHRVSAHQQDSEFAALLLLPDNAGVADTYLAALAPLTRSDEQLEAWEITHLVQAAAFSRTEAVDTDLIVSRARRAWEIQKGTEWFAMVLAIAHYRAGAYQEAWKLVAPLKEYNSHAFANPQLPYVKCIIAAALGDASEARIQLARGESLYRQACLESLAHPAVNATGLPSENWHELIKVQAERREALRRMQGQEPGDDPWQHLIQARGYRLIGEIAQADRELAAAEAAAPGDADVWMARARLLAQWNDPARSVDAAWQRAVELAGDNPLARIQRGRWYAEQGELDQADTDFAQAAALTPHELNKFLEAGWWVVGPYPADLKAYAPPERDPDPSQPVRGIDSGSGGADQRVPWRPGVTGRWGRVDLSSVLVGEGHASVYALAYVYAPAEQTKLLMIQKSQPLRVWVNGELIEDATPVDEVIQPHYEPFHRVPVVLRAGRNAILVKSTLAEFTLRIGDTPRDRAVLLAEQEQFTAAYAALEAMSPADRVGQSEILPHELHHLVALLGTEEQWRESCRRLIDSAESADAGNRFSIAYRCANRANPILQTHAQELVGYVETTVTTEKLPWGSFIGALVHYRAGNWERSRALLEQTQWKPYRLCLDPLLAHQAGDTSTAQRLLEEAFSAGKAYEASLM